MNVLHVISYFAPAYVYGGPPRSVLGLCRGLLHAGARVQVFTTSANGTSELPATPGAATLVDGVPARYFARRFPKRWFNAKGLQKAIRNEIHRFDLVHVHGLWTFPGSIAASLSRRSGVPYVLSPRGMLDSGSLRHHALRKRVLFAAFERGSLREALFVHATSDAEAASVRAHCPGVRVAVVPNGVALPTEAGHQRKPGGPIVYLGRLHPTKRLDLLLSAFDQVSSSIPDARLVLAGRSDGVDPRTLCDGREEKVSWAGHLEDGEKWALLREASALVLCSDSESFGMSVVEALAAGVPVVATRTCPWEELESFGCGFWVDQDVNAVADGVMRILRDPEAAKRMGERGRELVARRYDWHAVAKCMLDHYLRAVSSVPARRPLEAS